MGGSGYWSGLSPAETHHKKPKIKGERRVIKK